MNQLITKVFVEQPLALPGSANNKKKGRFHVISAKFITLWKFLTLRKSCRKKCMDVVISHDLGLCAFFFCQNFYSPKIPSMEVFGLCACLVYERAYLEIRTGYNDYVFPFIAWYKVRRWFKYFIYHVSWEGCPKNLKAFPVTAAWGHDSPLQISTAKKITHIFIIYKYSILNLVF